MPTRVNSHLSPFFRLYCDIRSLTWPGARWKFTIFSIPFSIYRYFFHGKTTSSSNIWISRCYLSLHHYYGSSTFHPVPELVKKVFPRPTPKVRERRESLGTTLAFCQTPPTPLSLKVTQETNIDEFKTHSNVINAQKGFTNPVFCFDSFSHWVGWDAFFIFYFFYFASGCS